MKKALLIVNLGTPNKPTYFSVFRYLRQFLMDGRVFDINPILRFFLVSRVSMNFKFPNNLTLLVLIFLKKIFVSLF